MPMTDEQMALFAPYQERIETMIERARQSRAAGKSAVADRQLEMCVDIYREYAMSQQDIRLKVAYLGAIAASFAMQMGMHFKADQVMRDAERMCPQDDAELRQAVARMRVQVDRYREANYHPINNPKLRRG